MSDHEKAIGIPPNHKLVQTDMKWSQRKGQDTDTYYYDHVDENGVVVAKYVLRESISVYPPFAKSISHEKVS